MIRIVVRQETTDEYIGEYKSSIVPTINEVISTPYTNYLVVGVQHNLSHRLNWGLAEFEYVTVYTREQ